jgi:iron complex transport system ATP-binding protein
VTARIEITDVHVMLKDRAVLSDVSCDLNQAGLIALAGPNGAGKSTLLKALAGLLPVRRGSIRIGGHALASWPVAERARKLAYLPQDRTVHWPLPARAIVALGRLPHRLAGAANSALDDQAIDAALATMDATHLADRPVLELSGGERARILIARALAQSPAVLLADEPASGLDPAHQWALFEALAHAADAGTRVVVALHDLTLASRFARHMVILADGRIAASGTPAEVLTADTLARVYGITAEIVASSGHQLIVPSGRVAAH